MLITNDVLKNRYTGNGATTAFPITFPFFENAHVAVFGNEPGLDVQRIDPSKYTLVGASNPAGGTCTFKVAPAANFNVAIVRDVPITQLHKYTELDNFPAESHEDSLAKLTMICQQLAEEVGRTIKVPVTSDDPPELLAELIFKARDEAIESAAEALVSETNAAASAATSAALLEEVKTEHSTSLSDIANAKGDALTNIAGAKNDALTNIAGAQGTALSEIGTAHSTALTEITREGQIQVNNVQQVAANVTLITTQAITDILDTGAQQEQRLRSVGDEQTLNVILEGNAQEGRVHASATQATVEIAAQVQVAGAEADRAKREADRAQDISNIGPASKTQRGWMIVGNGLRVDPDGKVHADIPSFLSLPVAGFPADAAIGYPATLTLSSETSIAGATVNRFMVVFDGAPAVEVQADTPGHATWTVTPTGTVHNQVATIIATAYDSNNNASNDATVTFTKKIVEVAAPLVLSPVSGAVDVALLPVITLQAGATTGMPSTNEKTQVQIARDADFTDMVWDSGEVAYASSVTVTSLLPDDASLYIRARHKVSTYGWSAWGRASGFTTIKKAVLKPRILAPAQGALNQSLSSTITLSALQTTGLAPAGRYTQVQIARDAAFADVVWDSGDASAYGVNKATSNLPVNTYLYCRGRHNDSNLGWSAWTDTVSFTTLNAYTNKPAVTAPANNAVDVARKPTFQFSPISNVGPVDYGVETQIHVATDAGFANVIWNYQGGYLTQWVYPADLGIFAHYYVRVRHRGAAWGWSAWSAVVQFQTLNIYVNPPSVVSPANGATGVGLTPLLQMSQPTAVNQVIKSTAFHVATDPGFTNIIAQGPFGDGSQLAYQVPANILAINTLYYVRAWAQGSITDWAHGADVSFRTVNGWVNAPTLTSPTANATVAGDEVYFTSSAFSVSHTTDTHVATDFALNKVVNGVESQFWGTGELTGGNLLAFKANVPNFEEDVQYRAYVRHKGQNLGWSAWSVGVPVRIGRAQIIIFAYSHRDNKYWVWSKRSVDGKTWGALQALDFPVVPGSNDQPRVCGGRPGESLITYHSRAYLTRDYKSLIAVPIYTNTPQSMFYCTSDQRYYIVGAGECWVGEDLMNLQRKSVYLPGALNSAFYDVIKLGNSYFLVGASTRAGASAGAYSEALYETMDFQTFTSRPYPLIGGSEWDRWKFTLLGNAIMAFSSHPDFARTYMLSTNGINWTKYMYNDTSSFEFLKTGINGAFFNMSKGKYVTTFVAVPFNATDLSDRNNNNMWWNSSYTGNAPWIVNASVSRASEILTWIWYKITSTGMQAITNPFTPQDLQTTGPTIYPYAVITGA